MATRKMKILAIDDNSINLATLEQKLKDEYDIIPMINGRRALKFLYCEKVDLILLDVQMPMMDGMETLREIRKLKNGVTIPVIFLTAMKDKFTVIEGSKLGIMDYITKPFETEDLKKRIDFALKRVGVCPMETKELLECLTFILDDLKHDKLKQAAGRMEELTGYQIDNEIIGRVRIARSKLDKNDEQAALNDIEKVYQMLKSSSGGNWKDAPEEVSDRRIYSSLMIISDELEKFRTKEAIEECKKLQRFLLPDDIADNVNQLFDKLMAYDDDGANDIIAEIIAGLNI